MWILPGVVQRRSHAEPCRPGLFLAPRQGRAGKDFGSCMDHSAGPSNDRRILHSAIAVIFKKTL